MKLFTKILVIMIFFGLFFNKAQAEEILTWEDCLREAKKNHPDLISAIEDVNQEKAGKSITASTLYPQINADLDASTKKTTTTSATTGAKTSSTANSYSYGISGSQLLFDGLKTVTDVKSASENVKAAQEGYRFTSSEIRLNLRTAFINLLKAQEFIRVAEEIASIRRGNLELITLCYQSGLEHRGALLTAEANLSEANFELSQAKRDVELAQRQLAKEMGRMEFKPVYVKGEFIVRDTAKDKPDFQELARSNPSLLQLAARKNAASFDVRSAYANFSPQVSGQFGADKSSSHWPPEGDNWNAGLSMTMPIFEGGLRSAQLSKARSAYRQAEADERSKKDSVVVNLEQAWTDLQDALERVDVQRKSLDAAIERSKIAEAQYSIGFIDFDSWTIIEDNLVTAKKAFLNVQANALLREADWIQAKGETLEYAQ